MKIDVSRAVATIQDMVNGLIALLPNLVLAILVSILFFLLGRGVRTMVRKLTSRYPNYQNVGLLLGRLAQGTIGFIGLLLALAITVPSFKPAQVIQLLGISGVAIGFAFKDIFQNFLAGILLLITEPFRLGDQIVAGGYEGTVEDIQTRATTIKTYDGRRVVIPNAELFTGSVVVNTAFEFRRTEYEVGIAYSDDIAKAKAIIMRVLHQTPGVVEAPAPDVLTIALADSSVQLRARWWSLPQRGEILSVQDTVITDIKSALHEGGISIPFPMRHVLLYEQSVRVDGINQLSPAPRPHSSQNGDTAATGTGKGDSGP